MNQQRLDELKQRAERATSLAAEIKRLREADPHRSGARLTFKDFNTDKSYIEGDLLKKVVAEGRLKVLADMEAELESLLGAEPAADQENDHA